MHQQSDKSFAIREYHDVREIYKQIRGLVQQDIHPIRREEMDRYISGFSEKYKSSKPLIEEAMNYIPGGVQHNLAFNYPFPIVFDKAEGAYLYDRDGNRHIDFLQAGGPTVLGSNYPAVREKVFDLINTTGPSTGLFHEYELKIARFICEHFLRWICSGCWGAVQKPAWQPSGWHAWPPGRKTSSKWAAAIMAGATA